MFIKCPNCGKTIVYNAHYHCYNCSCGKCYNAAGQELAPLDQWKDEYDAEDAMDDY